ncbi:MAG: DUF2752 domain-containing protein [Ilumatobacteraceae bacterium]
MDHVAPAPAPHVEPRSFGRWSGRLGVVVSAGALAGAAGLVARFDPAAPGSRFPGCTFHRLTGWWCPGCGLTRGVHHLLRGDVIGALGSNVFTPFVVIAVVAAWASWARRSFGFSPSRLRAGAHVRQRAGACIIVAMAAYSVARNLPFDPFAALAP